MRQQFGKQARDFVTCLCTLSSHACHCGPLLCCVTVRLKISNYGLRNPYSKFSCSGSELSANGVSRPHLVSNQTPLGQPAVCLVHLLCVLQNSSRLLNTPKVRNRRRNW